MSLSLMSSFLTSLSLAILSLASLSLADHKKLFIFLWFFAAYF